MFKEKIKALRLNKGLTQEGLAKILNVERSSVGKWEGKSCVIPSNEVVKKICEYFNVTMDFLMLDKEKAATLSDDGLNAEFATLIGQLTPSEQKLLLAQINGILQARE